MVRKVGAPGGEKLAPGGGDKLPPISGLSKRAEKVAKQIIPNAKSRTDAKFKHEANQVQGNSLYQRWFG